MLITTMFIQLSEFNFAQPTCKALYGTGGLLRMRTATVHDPFIGG
jgi:hypothetical protein